MARFYIQVHWRDWRVSRLRRRAAISSRLHVRTRASIREPKEWLKLRGVTRNNLHRLDADFPLGVFTSVTGVSGSGKSTLVSQVLVDLVAEHLGQPLDIRRGRSSMIWSKRRFRQPSGEIASGAEHIRRLVVVDQKPIGRTPRSNMATYTGLFDHVRKLFASTKLARVPQVRRRPFFLQCRQGTLRNLRGRGLRLRGTSLPAQRLQPMPYVPRCPLQCQDTRSALPRKEYCRCACPHRRCCCRVLLGRCASRTSSSGLAGSRPRVSASGAARDGALRRRSPTCEARHRAPARAARTDSCTSSTNPRPDCILRMSIVCCVNCRILLPLAIPSLSSSMICR